MTEWWQVALAIVGGLAIVWIALIAALAWEARKHPDGATFRDLLRLAPDVVRLLGRLVRDRRLGWRVRGILVLLLVYLLSPIDLVPDIIPVIGYADDAIIVALALRLAVRRAGLPAVAEHWPGTAAGLEVVLRLAGISQTFPGDE